MYVFIVNPFAGQGRAASLWKEIEEILLNKKLAYIVLESESETAAQQFIEENRLANPIKSVVVIGGDGTINTVIQSIANTNIALAILPAGSGNDAARALRLTNKPMKFIEQLLEHRTTTLDLLNVNGRFGMTVAGIGIDAMIGQRVDRSFYKPLLNKLGIGSFAYTIAAILELLIFQPYAGKVVIDGKTYSMKMGWLIACGNTSSYGGGLIVCPTALPTDGLLNLTMLRDVGRMTILFRLFPKLLQGKPIYRKGVTYIEGKEIFIQNDRPVSVILDGEIITTTPIHIKIREKALQLVMTSEKNWNHNL